MGQGNYDHPSYLTRQQIILGPTTAGAAGTSCHVGFNSQMRLRQAVACVAVAGTVGTNVAAILFGNGTNIISGTMAYGTAGNTIGALATSADMNYTLPAGQVLAVKNGADATATTRVTIEANLDPAATWTGNG